VRVAVCDAHPTVAQLDPLWPYLLQNRELGRYYCQLLDPFGKVHCMPLPGLVGTDHIGFTVPDLDEAHDFFVRVLGCAHVYTLGPYAHGDDGMAEHLNVHPRTVMRELRFYRCGTGANFEVFQYEAAD